MSTYIIEGGHRLHGSIHPQGAKNEALQVISATLLTSKPVTIHNVPNILDVINRINMLRAMRVKIDKLDDTTYRFQADDLDEDYISSADFVARCASLRGSVLVVGPPLARLGQAYFAKPGGDKIGRRRVDTH
ncbi:MAG: UDP-N-acetylglucosamine 1-carboxyvinyltransferase, partial [Duncaniella sp.]|nr:UDP-N-acetylglucosamine 1-carboxyvinyltransferase [Duncaniella sp.]